MPLPNAIRKIGFWPLPPIMVEAWQWGWLHLYLWLTNLEFTMHSGSTLFFLFYFVLFMYRLYSWFTELSLCHWQKLNQRRYCSYCGIPTCFSYLFLRCSQRHVQRALVSLPGRRMDACWMSHVSHQPFQKNQRVWAAEIQRWNRCTRDMAMRLTL